ncbi:carbohydrate ABC transporter permease [Oceanispirochaeta crateris]|uniref:Carbohydrate ABC transporter permease n=1 Tax=Oceanispirochaeta crateris TaxID=2518645 RepID=A0A5C1QLD3_9SPIO|nr:carbohydrate ABC transporter permease [Oceanispirochaeta crateris]QEN06962.1 carbohydrate ABC transporter permease [Oceanispirochaeta crateris]
MIGELRFKGAGIPQKILIILFQLMLITYAILIFYPLFNMIISSLKTTREIFKTPYALPADWKFSNYGEVWGEGGFGRYFFNSSYITALSIGIVILFGSMAAFGISRYDYRLSTLVYLLFLAGIMLPLKAAIIPLFLLIRKLHLMDNQLSLILIFTAMSMPSTVFILTGFMKTIPYDLEDSGRIDGANEWVIYKDIIMPLTAPSIALVTIYNAVPVWNDFFFPLVFIQSNKLKTLPLGMSVFFGQYQISWHLLFASLSITILPMLILYLFMSKYFIKGMTAGALK